MGTPERVKFFIRAVAGMMSTGMNDDLPINGEIDISSLDVVTGETVIHQTDQVISGAAQHFCFLGRLSPGLALDIVFSAGTVQLRSLSVNAIRCGRLFN